MKYIAGLLLFIVLSSGRAQNGMLDRERELAFYADVMVNASKPAHRHRAAVLFEEQFLEALAQPNSFNYPFDSLTWIARASDAENTFRLFTWMVDPGGDSLIYNGIFQASDDQLIRLKDQSVMPQDYRYLELGPENWFGQVYYDFREFSITGGEKQFLLYGKRITPEGNILKTIEPLSWNGQELRFGEELFYKSSRHGAFRLIIDYFSGARAGLAYDDDLEMIVFDHLVPVVNPYESGKTIWVPDGTLEAYRLSDDRWEYVEQVFDEKYAEPPVPQPVLEQRDKNIIGKG